MRGFYYEVHGTFSTRHAVYLKLLYGSSVKSGVEIIDAKTTMNTEIKHMLVLSE